MSCLLLLLPSAAWASEPCGPGEGFLTAIVIIGGILLTSFISLILLLIQPRAKSAYHVFLVISLLLYATFYITAYRNFSYHEDKPSRLAAFGKMLFTRSDDGQSDFMPVCSMVTLCYWGIMIAHFWWRRRRMRTSVRCGDLNHPG